jgi:putative intracellular protease/amidase
MALDMGKSVVIVNTSAGSMGGRPTGVWLSELADPYYAFKEAGLDVTIASIAGGAIPIDPGSMGENYFGEKAKKFMLDQAAVAALTHSVKVDAAMADQFDCVYLAGGHGCCVDFVGPQASELKALIEAAYQKGKVVAADCHGPMGLLEATIMVDMQEGAKGIYSESLVKGLEVTAFTNVEEDQAGATEWVTASARIKFCGVPSLVLCTGQGQLGLHGGRIPETRSGLQEGRPLDGPRLQVGDPSYL